MSSFANPEVLVDTNFSGLACELVEFVRQLRQDVRIGAITWIVR